MGERERTERGLVLGLAETDARVVPGTDPPLFEVTVRADPEAPHGPVGRCVTCVHVTSYACGGENAAPGADGCDAYLRAPDPLAAAREEGRRAGLAEALAACEAVEAAEQRYLDSGGWPPGKEMELAERVEGAARCVEAVRSLAGGARG